MLSKEAGSLVAWVSRAGGSSFRSATQAGKGYVSPFSIASRYAFLGDKKETLKYVEQAYGIRDPWLIMLQTEPVLDFLHSEPRYQKLIRNLGLTRHG